MAARVGGPFDLGRTLGAGRLRILRRLGEGGMGVVYEALDIERQARVAIKTVHTMTATTLARFKREFRAVQDLHHPNLVSLGELVSEDDAWFFTMELVEGKDFLEYVRPREPWRALGGNADAQTEPPGPPGPPSGEQIAMAATERFSRSDELPIATSSFDEVRLRSALRQLAAGLAALHDAGVVHRDIKPSNIRVTEEGRVVLLDFGLVADVASGASDTGSNIVGTPAYMAPEQATNTPARPEADSYSVGILLYEALTGQVPFDGAPLRILMRKHQETPAAPSSIAPNVPPDLEKLCLALLAVDPATRPSARQILTLVGTRHSKLPPPPRAPASGAQGAIFVGRGAELEALMSAFRKSRTDGPMCVIVQGESGLGKSCLLRHFGEKLAREERDVLLLRGRCYERETVPYKAFDGVIDSLTSVLTRMPAQESRRFVPTRPGPLLQIFPVMRRWEPIATSLTAQPVAMDPLELRNRAFDGLRELLSRLVQERPVVVVIDDIQWADADSLTLLKELLRAPDAPEVLVLASMRTLALNDASMEVAKETTGTAVRALRYIAVVVAAIPCPLKMVDLGRMSSDEARSLASMLLEQSAPDRRADADTIASEAAGHPFFIDALARYAAGGDSDVGTAPRLEDALMFSVSRLEEPARALFELVATAAVPITQQALAFASGSDGREFARNVGRLRASNLVSTSGVRATDTVEPYHDRVRAAVTAKLSAPRRRELHRSLALALERIESRDFEALAEHWQGADVPARAARYAASAADEAVLTLAFDRAVRLYERAIALSQADDPTRQSLFEKLGNALASAGRGARSAAAYREAATGAKHADALDLHRRAADQLLRSGHFDDGLEATARVLEAVGLKFPTNPLVWVMWIVLVRLYVRVRGLGFRRRDSSQLAAEELTRVDVVCSVAFSLAIVDTLRGAAFQARHLVLALRCGEPYRVGRALAYEIGYLGTTGRRAWPRARAVTALAKRVAMESKSAQLDALVIANEGLSYYLNGHFKTALELFTTGREMFVTKCTGSAWEIDTMQLFALNCCAQLGMLQKLCADAPRFLRDSLDRGDIYGSVGLRVGFPNLQWLVTGNVDTARAEVKDAMSQWSKQGFHLEHFYALIALVHADLYAGSASEAHARVERAAPALRTSLLMRVQSVRILSGHLRVRTAIAAAAVARGMARKDLLASAARDARRLEKERTPWATSIALGARAGIHMVNGDRDRAARALDDAIRAADAADMALHAASARYALGGLTAGDAGTALRARASEWMASEGVSEPARLASIFAPGFES